MLCYQIFFLFCDSLNLCTVLCKYSLPIASYPNILEYTNSNKYDCQRYLIQCLYRIKDMSYLMKQILKIRHLQNEISFFLVIYTPSWLLPLFLPKIEKIWRDIFFLNCSVSINNFYIHVCLWRVFLLTKSSVPFKSVAQFSSSINTDGNILKNYNGNMLVQSYKTSCGNSFFWHFYSIFLSVYIDT